MNRAALIWYTATMLALGFILGDFASRDTFPDRECTTDTECERACGPDEPAPQPMRVRL